MGKGPIVLVVGLLSMACSNAAEGEQEDERLSSDIRAFIEGSDTDDDNSLTFAEFHASIDRNISPSELSVEELQCVFDSYDTDDDGHLRIEEMQDFMSEAAYKPTELIC